MMRMEVDLPWVGFKKHTAAWGFPSLIILACLFPRAALAQSAAVSLTEAVATNIAYVNGGGFSLVSDGGFRYEGPINIVAPIESVDAVRIVINDQTLIDGVPQAIQDLVESGESRANSLSPELVRARVELSDQRGLVLGIGGQIATYVELGGILEKQRTVVVGGQSLSIFPDLEPSVFNRPIAP